MGRLDEEQAVFVQLTLSDFKKSNSSIKDLQQSDYDNDQQ